MLLSDHTHRGSLVSGLGSGSTVVLDGLPTGASLTVDGGTTVDLDGQSVDLGTHSVTLLDGTITDGSPKPVRSA